MKEPMNAKRSGISIASLVLVIILLAANVFPCFAGIETTKRTKTRDIAIVFDNSGSMYLDSNAKAWCRATYAMEVFAAMLNSEDKLRIYPMWPVEVSGKAYSMEDPLTVTSSNASAVRDMYTPNALGTPIESITAAYNGLLNSTMDEKWLIVLTDGDSFYENNKDLKKAATKQRLTEMLSEYNKSMNVMYLGIGKNSVLPEVTGNTRYVYNVVQAKDSNSVLSNLSTMCNAVFGRDALKVSDNSIKFDIPMKKLILFVQGQEIGGVSLQGYSSNPSSTYNPHYGELGSNRGKQVDASLQGTIATYEDIPAGSYKIEFTGKKSSIDVYYEPDVTLKCELYNADGELLDDPEKAYPGTYTLQYGLAAKTDAGTYEYTVSELLGDVNYTVNIDRNGETSVARGKSPGSVPIESLKMGDYLNAEIKATYLKNYQVTLTGGDIGWPDGGWQILRQRPYVLTGTLSITQDYYQISKIDKSDPVCFDLLLNGQPLTKEEMDALSIKVDFEGINTKVEPSYDKSSFKIWLQKGDYKDGKYKLTAKATGLDFDGNEVSVNDSEVFKIKTFPSWLKWAILGLALLILAVLTFIIMNLPALPKTGKGRNTTFTVDGDDGSVFGQPTVAWNKLGSNQAQIVARSPQVDGSQLSATIKVKTLGKIKDRKTDRMLQVQENGISGVPSNVSSIEIGSTTFERNEIGKWVPEEGSSWPKIRHNGFCTLYGNTSDGKSMELAAQMNFNSKK